MSHSIGVSHISSMIIIFLAVIERSPRQSDLCPAEQKERFILKVTFVLPGANRSLDGTRFDLNLINAKKTEVTVCSLLPVAFVDTTVLTCRQSYTWVLKWTE